MRSKGFIGTIASVLAGTGLIVAVAAGCSTSAPAGGAGAAQSDYPVGVVLPLTGGEATQGLDHLKDLQMAADDIKAKDGIQFKLIGEDSQADPKRAVTAFEKVTSVDKAPVVVSSWSSVVKAMGPLAEERKVLLLSTGASDPTIKDLGDYTRTDYPLSNVDTTAMARYTAKKLGLKQAAIIYINNASGKFAVDVYKQAFEAAGGKVIDVESHEPQAIDYRAQIDKIKAAKPDVIHIQSLLTETPQIVSQIRQAGITAQLTSYSGAETTTMFELAPTASEGLLYTSLAPDESVPAVKEFMDRWVKVEKRKPNGPSIAVYMYDTMHILNKLVQSVKDKKVAYTGENLLKTLKDTKTFDVPFNGQLTFADDRTVKTPVYIRKIQNKAFVQVEKLPLDY